MVKSFATYGVDVANGLKKRPVFDHLAFESCNFLMFGATGRIFASGAGLQAAFHNQSSSKQEGNSLSDLRGLVF